MLQCFLIIFTFVCSITSDSELENNRFLLNRVYREFNILREDLSKTKTKLNFVEKNYEEEKIKNSVLSSQNKLFKLNNTQLNSAKKQLLSKNNILKKTNLNLSKNLDLYKSHLDFQVTLSSELTKNLSISETENSILKTDISHYILVINSTRSRFDDCVKDQIPMFCDFENNGLCGFSIEGPNSTKWTLNEITDVSLVSKFNPKSDHTCYKSKGNFMAIKATNISENYGRIYSKRLFGTNEQCLTFYYFINGKNAGLLNVIIEVPDAEKFIPVLRIYGSQGNIWIEARLNIAKDYTAIGFRVIFEGRLEKGNEGIIAIDDFNILNSIC